MREGAAPGEVGRDRGGGSDRLRGRREPVGFVWKRGLKSPAAADTPVSVSERPCLCGSWGVPGMPPPCTPSSVSACAVGVWVCYEHPGVWMC